MAQHNPSTLASALRHSAQRLRDGAHYEWGHVGRCNCGHLVQSLTDLGDAEIFKLFQVDLGEWSELANDYCPTTGGGVDELFNTLFQHGMTLRDVQHLEWLSDPRVLERMPSSRRRELRRNVREDVIDYMEAYAERLDEVAAPANA